MAVRLGEARPICRLDAVSIWYFGGDATPMARARTITDLRAGQFLESALSGL